MRDAVISKKEAEERPGCPACWLSIADVKRAIMEGQTFCPERDSLYCAYKRATNDA